MRKIYYLLILWVFSYTIEAQNRGAIFMHGLNDNWTQWRTYSNRFTSSRRIDGLANPSLDTKQGIEQIANQCRNGDGANYVGYAGSQNPNNIFFGHSMGGVVGRHLDVRPNAGFGGIITAGSPLDGAKIVNSIQNGNATWYVADGQSRVLRGLVRDVAYFVPGLEQIVDKVLFGLVAVEQLFFISPEVSGQGPQDLGEGSSYMNTWQNRNQQTNTAKIHIYGNENSPTVWRLISCAIGDGKHSGGNDEEYVRLARTAGDISEAAMWANIAVGTWQVIASWACGGCAGWYWFYAADGWREGMNWWRDDSDRGWNVLIGSDTPASKTVCYQNVNWQAFGQCMNNAGSSAAYMYCQNASIYTDCYTYYASVNNQSDAFIKAPSQIGYNSEWSNNAVKIEALGVNHLEMGDHPTMDGVYNRIFENNVPEGDVSFFITPTR